MADARGGARRSAARAEGRGPARRSGAAGGAGLVVGGQHGGGVRAWVVLALSVVEAGDGRGVR